LKIVTVLIILLLLAAAIVGLHKLIVFLMSDKYMPSVSDFVNKYYQARNEKDYAYIYNTMADEAFREKVPYGNFVNTMSILEKQIGKMKKTTRGAIKATYTPEGQYVETQYKTIHEKGQNVDWFLLKEKGPTWQFVGYRIVWSSKDLKEKPELTPEDYTEMRKMIHDMIDKSVETSVVGEQ